MCGAGRHVDMAVTDAAFAHHLIAMAVKTELDAIFSQATLPEWIQRFATVDCCVSPVLLTEEAIQHPHILACAMIAQDQHPTEGTYLKTEPAVRFCK
jgi:alpha-methylacyl-CoA racemase